MHVILLILTVLMSNGDVRTRSIVAPSLAACQAILPKVKVDIAAAETDVRGVDARCVEVVVPDIA